MECMILRGDQWECVKVAYEDSLNIESNNIQNDMRYRRSEMYVCICISRYASISRCIYAPQHIPLLVYIGFSAIQQSVFWISLERYEYVTEWVNKLSELSAGNRWNTYKYWKWVRYTLGKETHNIQLKLAPHMLNMSTVNNGCRIVSFPLFQRFHRCHWFFRLWLDIRSISI